jgi:predicted DNA-binding protein with PD1-like motif
MEYRRFDDTIVLRLDPGDEILEQIAKVADEEKIELAEISGLGAVNEFTVGVFYTAEKQYHSNSFEGYYEITSLTGTITTINDQPYLHIHMSAGDVKGNVVGGHLNRARVSATSEIVIRTVKGHVGRKMSEEIGLNLFDFT